MSIITYGFITSLTFIFYVIADIVIKTDIVLSDSDDESKIDILLLVKGIYNTITLAIIVFGLFYFTMYNMFIYAVIVVFCLAMFECLYKIVLNTINFPDVYKLKIESNKSLAVKITIYATLLILLLWIS